MRDGYHSPVMGTGDDLFRLACGQPPSPEGEGIGIRCQKLSPEGEGGAKRRKRSFPRFPSAWVIGSVTVFFCMIFPKKYLQIAPFVV